MAPMQGASASVLHIKRARDLIIRSNGTDTTAKASAFSNHAWHGNFSVTSVDLIAMVVSDAGLASANPEWWNCSPTGCFLIGLQPRGGWQVMQRAVQWGDDRWSHCFGIKCDMPVLYQYFACTVRNRLEVWDSTLFISPTRGPDPPSDEQPTPSSEAVPGTTNVTAVNGVTENRLSKKAHWWAAAWKAVTTKKQDTELQKWKTFSVPGRGDFSVARPTKLIDGSRGGQAFMCKLLVPKNGQAYGVEEQARMQLLSVLLVAASLTDSNAITMWAMMEKEFAMSTGLGKIFQRLRVALLICEIPVLGFIAVICYSLWWYNLFGKAVPYAIQLCSLLSWSTGAMGLLMLGGNPRVEIEDKVNDIPEHIDARLFEPPGSPTRANSDTHARHGQRKADADNNIDLEFGYLQGATFQPVAGTCKLSFDQVQSICGLKIILKRPWQWKLGMAWYASHLLASIMLQISSTTTATIGSQSMGVVILILTSVFRGMGVAGPEEWMIPKWAMREGASYAVAMQGKKYSRT